MVNEQLPYHKSSTDDDLLPVVNDRDEVIGSAPRREVHLKCLLHRAVHAVVVDGKGNVLLQLRSMLKDSHPGWWDISMGGHVDVGETYEAALTRELREELGIDATGREVARRDATVESGWEFVRIYEVHCTGPFSPAKSEIDELRWVTTDELLERADPGHDDPMWRITHSGLSSIRLWATKQNS